MAAARTSHTRTDGDSSRATYYHQCACVSTYTDIDRSQNIEHTSHSFKDMADSVISGLLGEFSERALSLSSTRVRSLNQVRGSTL